MLTILGCLTMLFTLGSVRGKTIVTYPRIQPVYIKSGDTLKLNCEQSEGFKIHWLKADKDRQYKIMDSNNATGVFFLSHVEGKQIVELIKDNVTLDDEGSYRCAVQSGTDMPYAVDVYVVQVDQKEGLITHLGNSTTIGCIISSVEKVSVEAYWSRNDKPIEIEPDSTKYSENITYSGNTTEFMLTVKHVGEADVGIYQCNVTLKNGKTFIHDVHLKSFPQVKSMGRSKNLVAGLTLELSCKVWGWPSPKVYWEIEGKPLNESDNRISVTDGTLRIENIAAADRAVYTCIAWSNISNVIQQTSTSILVRVKGKLAMLWPLLGIALEVIILSCIIYVYERNRARQRAELERSEAADHQPNSNAQTRHQGRDNVRYRK